MNTELWKAALFGLVEGITEWLPISSTGHMLLLNEFVTLDVSKDFWDMFLVVIQLGAILAVCVLFFGQLNPFSLKKTPTERKATWRLWAQVIVACIPAAAVGIPLDDWMEEHLGSPFVIAGALIVYGIAFIVIECVRARKASRRGAHFKRGSAQPGLLVADEDARFQDVHDLTWPAVLGIGAFQILSIVPGFFGILGLGQIYRNYRQKRGYVFLLLGLFFAIGAITLLLFPIPEFFVSVFKTIAGIGMGFIYAILFLLSVLDSLASTSIVVR